MDVYEDQSELEATNEQLDQLRELGLSGHELEGLSMSEAEELIAQMRAEREARW